MERFAGVFVMSIVGFFIEGWMLMLFLGGVHHEVIASIHPIGYWTACVLSVPLDALFVSYFSVTLNRVEEIHKAVVR